MKRTILLISILVAAVIAVVVIAATAVTNSGKNLPNVFVGSVDVSGMTQEETVQALKDAGWEDQAAKPLVVSLLNVVDIDVDPVRAGYIKNAETVARKASEYGHSDGLLKNLLTYLKARSSKVDINELHAEPDDEYLDSVLMQGFDYMNEYFGIEEYYLDYDNDVLKTTKGWGQIDFDEADLKQKIGEAILRGDSMLSYTTLTKEPVMPDFQKINDSMEKTMVDARYSDDGKFEVIDEVNACEFDVAQAQQTWQNAAVAERITIPMKVTRAAVTGEELRTRLFHDLLGAMSTRYTNSAENRCSNVRLCASHINETVVYPGEVFSYNQVVGARTEEAGFLPAPAYVGLDAEETVKDEVGGGACQVSSTTYAASLFAFLETVERACHIYPVNYMQLGIDATVTIPEEGQEMDFKFRNSKNYPVKIVAYTEENDTEKKVTVEIWGTLEENDYMPVEFDASYSWTQDYDRFIEKAYPDRPGYKIKLEHDTYTDATDTGTLTSTQTWRRVFDEAGSLVEETITNLPNPATGEPSMDQYHQHP